MNPPRLRILMVAANGSEARFASRVLEDHGDEVKSAQDVPEALSKLAKDTFEVALVSLSLPRGDGLALVHHLRALYPHVDVVVMASAQEMEETAHAMALGVLANVMRPLTGDALLVAADRARERRMLINERARLAKDEKMSRRRTATYARCAAFVAETDTRAVARRVLDACLAEVECTHAAVYVPQYPGASQLVRAVATDDPGPLPADKTASELASVDPTNPIHAEGERLRLVMLGDAEVEAMVELMPKQLEGGRVVVTPERREALEVITALGTASLTAARKADAIARTGIKDPETSAYTFAYFGDVAGREIDRAARHGRRFALLILSVDGLDELRERLSADDRARLRRAAADALLDAVRDSDVLARVEDDEFYLLLPETGLLGALSCRRRIRKRFASSAEIGELAPDGSLDPVVGIAVYPTDGADLGRLLRVGRRRAERSRKGVWRRLQLGSKPFWESVDALLGTDSMADVRRDGSLALHDKLKDAHDEASLAQHAALPRNLLGRLGHTLAEDAMRHRVAGTMYVAGDSGLGQAVGRVMDGAGDAPLRAWVLGSPEEKVRRHQLTVDDSRLTQRILILSLTEIGGYVLLARPADDGRVIAFHTSDLDLVDGLVSSLQTVYHLQPEVA
jgi:diguanylate cyclase (GGDEF)-like protein